MSVPHDRAVARDAASIAGALRALLRFGSHILFVDPFFDPFSHHPCRYDRYDLLLEGPRRLSRPADSISNSKLRGRPAKAGGQLRGAKVKNVPVCFE